VVSAVFLDRDGVINANLERNGKPVAPTSLSEFRILPGVIEGVRLLKEAGFLLVVVTNQPDVANGLTPRPTVEAMHAEIRRQLPIDDIVVCFHADADKCSCRKPKPGMIFDAAARHGIDLASSYLVGDRWRDVNESRLGFFGVQMGQIGLFQGAPLDAGEREVRRVTAGELLELFQGRRFVRFEFDTLSEKDFEGADFGQGPRLFVGDHNVIAISWRKRSPHHRQRFG